jgi:hypothetical protein
MPTHDFSGLTNPKRVIDKRESAAAAPIQAEPQPPTPQTTTFAKPFTPEERAKQVEALRLFLAKRPA